MVPLLPGEGLWLPEFTLWLPQLNSMVTWSRFLVPCTWFHDCLRAIHFLVLCTWFPGSLVKASCCLDLVLGSLDLVPWLPDEDYGVLRFTLWFSRLGSIIAC